MARSQGRSEVRITTNLIDARSGCYVWSGAIDRKLENVFALQEEVGSRGRRATEDRAARRAARRRDSRHRAVNLAAHNLYVQGRYHLSQRTEEGLRKAVDFSREPPWKTPSMRRRTPAYRTLTDYWAITACSLPRKSGPRQRRTPRGPFSGRKLRRGAHLVGARQMYAGLGLARAERDFRRAIASTRDIQRHIIGTPCPVSRRSEGLRRPLPKSALRRSWTPSPL